MKKIYTLLTTLCLGSAAMAQDAFWTPTTYRGAFPVTDNTPATDWTSGWANFDPENAVYPATVTTVSADITTNTTWSGVVKLMNKVYVKNNATLTIAPGTIIRGDKLTQGSLIITRGAKIIADGTAANPIVFTSNEAVGARNEGDWGGLVLLGLAKNNQPGGVANIEGIVPTTDSQFGGNFDNDNSGILRYVRVEFAGIALEPNKEINGITFGSVGNQTIVDYVQVSFSGDDSFEWFGGTVNCKHIIAYRGLDDDFDCDFGYRGKVQFALSIRDKDISDAPGDSNAFECDNDATGSTAQPKTRPIFSNVTLVGPKGNGTTALPTGEKFEKAFRLRRNSAVSVLNSLVTGWEKGLSIEGAPVVANLNGDTMVFVNNILTNFAVPSWSANNTNTVLNSGGSTTAWYNSWWGVDGNDSTQTLAQVNWVNLFVALGTTPDARLGAGSVAANGATFLNPVFFSVAMPTVATTSYTYCQGATATVLSATAITGNTLRWYTQATGGTYTTTAPVPSTTTAGTYTYYVSQANAGNDESMRAAITVVVNALPATPTIAASGSTTFCTGGSVDLTSSAASGNVWSTNATTATITVSATGNYSVTVTDANGCSSTSASISVNVSSAPAPTISASSTQACSGDVVTVTASAADSYLWSTGETSQSIQVTNTAAVYVTVTNANACNGVGQSATTNITFTATPTAAGSFTTAGNVVTFSNTSTGATAYSWDFGDFTNSSATAPAHAYAANGTYTVVLTAINGNCTNTATFEISIEVGIEEATQMQFEVYPNPATEQIIVAFENTAAGSLNILDATGRVVFTQTYNEIGSVLLPINVSELASGSYTVQLINADQVGIKRLLIRK
ncbi:MAG: T9SS type A sorting domain-containing protein [Sphingomonadales bacterium]|nr:T9SS type A sorting domain-containing protein [Sphingomonadales bacterium]